MISLKQIRLKLRDLLWRAQFIISFKSVNEVLREYRDLLENWVVDAANGNISAASIARQMRKAVIDFAEEAYTEALRESGEELSDEDDKAIRDWILQQTPHIYDFADSAVAVSDLKGDEKTEARNAMLDRVDEWVDSLNRLTQIAQVNAEGDPFLTFDGDDGKDSCAECQKYQGQRHKKSWWENRGLLDRPNGNFGCGRFDPCQHHYYFDSGDLAID